MLPNAFHGKSPWKCENTHPSTSIYLAHESLWSLPEGQQESQNLSMIPSSALAKAVCLTLWSDVFRPSFQGLIIVKDLSKFRRWCADDTCWTSNSSGVWKLEMYVMCESHPNNVCKSTGHASGQKPHMFKNHPTFSMYFAQLERKPPCAFMSLKYGVLLVGSGRSIPTS